jgi:hypothetical protein
MGKCVSSCKYDSQKVIMSLINDLVKEKTLTNKFKLSIIFLVAY